MSTVPIDLDVELRRFARQAQSLTLAGGASIALASPVGTKGTEFSDEMTCRASAGSAAPEEGARLRLIHGYKNEWFRDGRPLRCDDSEKDSRVDRERCRKLGVRSMVAVPLRKNKSVVGVIEIFSPRTMAFTESHMAKLHVLAQRVSSAVTATEAVAVPVAKPEPELLWADLFVESSVPWKRLLQSAVCHVVVLGVVWNVSASLTKAEEIQRRSPAAHSQLTYYPTPSFPAAASRRPRAPAAESGGSQPAAAAPATPMMVKAGGGERSVAPPVVNMPATAGTSLAGMWAALPTPGPVDSPQRALAALGRGMTQTAIVAPPPQLGSSLRQQRMGAPGAIVVAPAPAVNGPVRGMANLSVGRSPVVGPAPGLPSRTAMASMNPSAGMGGVPAVVGPAPSLPLHEGSGGSGVTLGGGGQIVGPPTALPLHDGTAGSGMTLGGGYAVVGPAPNLGDGGGLRRGAGVGGASLGGGAGVVGPAPGIPTGARSGVLSASLGGMGGGTVIGPPPGIPNGGRGISSSGPGGLGVSVVPPAPSVGGGGGMGVGAGGGSGSGSGLGVGAGSGSGVGSGQGSGGSGTGSGSGVGSGSGFGSGSGLGSQAVGPAPSMAAVNTVAGMPQPAAMNIRSTVAPQAPTRLDDPPGQILDLPVRVLGLALALPSSSFFSNYEVFIAEREFAKNETQLIKLVYESRPTQQRLSDSGVNVAVTYKLRVKRDPSCDESAAQIVGNSSEAQSAPANAALGAADKDALLPCYRTTADDYQKMASKKKR